MANFELHNVMYFGFLLIYLALDLESINIDIIMLISWEMNLLVDHDYP